jgi:predicted nucleotidyltransferase
MKQSIHGNIEFDDEAVTDFCRRRKIVEMSLFGSVLRDDFGPESDVDVLVVFDQDASWSYWDWGPMSDELAAIFGRPVDLVERRSVVNPYRRHRILTTRQIIHRHAA